MSRLLGVRVSSFGFLGPSLNGKCSGQKGQDFGLMIKMIKRVQAWWRHLGGLSDEHDQRVLGYWRFEASGSYSTS